MAAVIAAKVASEVDCDAPRSRRSAKINVEAAWQADQGPGVASTVVGVLPKVVAKVVAEVTPKAGQVRQRANMDFARHSTLHSVTMAACATKVAARTACAKAACACFPCCDQLPTRNAATPWMAEKKNATLTKLDSAGPRNDAVAVAGGLLSFARLVSHCDGP